MSTELLESFLAACADYDSGLCFAHAKASAEYQKLEQEQESLRRKLCHLLGSDQELLDLYDELGYNQTAENWKCTWQNAFQVCTWFLRWMGALN